MKWQDKGYLLSLNKEVHLLCMLDKPENKWKKNMTLNAAVKLGLEALRDSLDGEDLNTNAVEIAVLDNSGYRLLDRDETISHIEKLPNIE